MPFENPNGLNALETWLILAIPAALGLNLRRLVGNRAQAG